jgi:hypothetical protein
VHLFPAEQHEVPEPLHSKQLELALQSTVPSACAISAAIKKSPGSRRACLKFINLLRFE